jgi:hypothetical protein
MYTTLKSGVDTLGCRTKEQGRLCTTIMRADGYNKNLQPRNVEAKVVVLSHADNHGFWPKAGVKCHGGCDSINESHLVICEYAIESRHHV